MAIENGRWTGPILDNHFHLDRKHRFLDAALDFKRVGGTDLVLVHKPDFDNLPIEQNAWKDVYQDTIDMANEVRKELALGVRVILGPHPATWVHQRQALGDELASELYCDAIDLAFEYCHQGDACAVGEVGRPHWQVEDEIWNRANELLSWTFRRAKKEGFPLQLHVEGEGASTYANLAKMADSEGLARDKLVRHHAPPDIDKETTAGLIPSVVVGKGSVEEIMENVGNCLDGFLMETDYMDDPRRLGAVLGPKTVPKRTQALVQAGLDEEQLMLIHHHLPEKIYGPQI